LHHCFVGHCVELGTSSSGENIEAAFEALDEATCLYLDTLEKVGEGPRLFEERGIRIEAAPPEEVEVKVRPGDYARSRSLPYAFA
jgi:predicted RNase H-like HicB family nuclease